MTPQSQTLTPQGLARASSGIHEVSVGKLGKGPEWLANRSWGFGTPGEAEKGLGASPGFPRATEQLLSSVSRVTDGFLFPLPFLAGYGELIMCQALVTHFSPSSKQLWKKAVAVTNLQIQIVGIREGKTLAPGHTAKN